MLLRVACLLVLCGILVAGLWPFHAPANNVRWLNPGTGVAIAKYGSVVTAGEFASRTSGTDDSCSLEIRLAPKRASASGSILAFYRPESHSSPLALRQSVADLSIESHSGSQPPKGNAKVYIDNVFGHPRVLLLTLTSNPAGTSVYVDGALVKAFRNFHFSTRELTGRLILGNSPFSTHEWSGEVRGLAMYARSLTAPEVVEHYRQWTGGTAPVQDESVVAFYRFDEGAGNVIHNRVNAATDLTIPARFFILDPQFLERPWSEFRNDRHYWKDIAVNICGFVPLGLLFFAYLSLATSVEHPAALTTLLGFAVSLTIEVGQAFLPTRNSGTTDLITNTLGTAIGAGLFRWHVVSSLVRCGAGTLARESSHVKFVLPESKRIGVPAPHNPSN